MKIKLKSTLYKYMFQSLFDLEIAIEMRQVHKRTFNKITFNTIILARRAIKILELNCFYIYFCPKTLKDCEPK